MLEHTLQHPFPKAIGCVEHCYRMAERFLAVDHTKLPHETATKMPLDKNRMPQSECDPLICDLEERYRKLVKRLGAGRISGTPNRS
jgi:hypothetical protein